MNIYDAGWLSQMAFEISLLPFPHTRQIVFILLLVQNRERKCDVYSHVLQRSIALLWLREQREKICKTSVFRLLSIVYVNVTDYKVYQRFRCFRGYCLLRKMAFPPLVRPEKNINRREQVGFVRHRISVDPAC